MVSKWAINCDKCPSYVAKYSLLIYNGKDHIKVGHHVLYYCSLCPSLRSTYNTHSGAQTNINIHKLQLRGGWCSSDVWQSAHAAGCLRVYDYHTKYVFVGWSWRGRRDAAWSTPLSSIHKYIYRCNFLFMPWFWLFSIFHLSHCFNFSIFFKCQFCVVKWSLFLVKLGLLCVHIRIITVGNSRLIVTMALRWHYMYWIEWHHWCYGWLLLYNCLLSSLWYGLLDLVNSIFSSTHWKNNIWYMQEDWVVEMKWTFYGQNYDWLFVICAFQMLRSFISYQTVWYCPMEAINS